MADIRAVTIFIDHDIHDRLPWHSQVFIGLDRVFNHRCDDRTEAIQWALDLTEQKAKKP